MDLRSNSVPLRFFGCTGVAAFTTLHLGQVPRKQRKKAPANRPQFDNSRFKRSVHFTAMPDFFDAYRCYMLLPHFFSLSD